MLALVYRFVPCRPDAPWRWITPGSVLATIIWLAATAGFGLYVASFGNYNATYGALGAVVGLMMWMWLSTIVVLIGAELNSEIEHQTAQLTLFAIMLLNIDDIVHPDDVTRRFDHAIIEFEFLGGTAHRETRTEGLFSVVGMDMRDPKVVFVPLLQRIAEQLDGLGTDIGKSPGFHIGLPEHGGCGLDQTAKILLAFA